MTRRTVFCPDEQANAEIALAMLDRPRRLDDSVSHGRMGNAIQRWAVRHGMPTLAWCQATVTEH
jgi:hypothetical protein